MWLKTKIANFVDLIREAIISSKKVSNKKKKKQLGGIMKKPIRWSLESAANLAATYFVIDEFLVEIERRKKRCPVVTPTGPSSAMRLIIQNMEYGGRQDNWVFLQIEGEEIAFDSPSILLDGEFLETFIKKLTKELKDRISPNFLLSVARFFYTKIHLFHFMKILFIADKDQQKIGEAILRLFISHRGNRENMDKICELARIFFLRFWEGDKQRDIWFLHFMAKAEKDETLRSVLEVTFDIFSAKHTIIPVKESTFTKKMEEQNVEAIRAMNTTKTKTGDQKPVIRWCVPDQYFDFIKECCVKRWIEDNAEEKAMMIWLHQREDRIESIIAEMWEDIKTKRKFLLRENGGDSIGVSIPILNMGGIQSIALIIENTIFPFIKIRIMGAMGRVRFSIDGEICKDGRLELQGDDLSPNDFTAIVRLLVIHTYHRISLGNDKGFSYSGNISSKSTSGAELREIYHRVRTRRLPPGHKPRYENDPERACFARFLDPAGNETIVRAHMGKIPIGLGGGKVVAGERSVNQHLFDYDRDSLDNILER